MTALLKGPPNLKALQLDRRSLEEQVCTCTCTSGIPQHVAPAATCVSMCFSVSYSWAVGAAWAGGWSLGCTVHSAVLLSLGLSQGQDWLAHRTPTVLTVSSQAWSLTLTGERVRQQELQQELQQWQQLPIRM